jgi:hypothetical protein
MRQVSIVQAEAILFAIGAHGHGFSILSVFYLYHRGYDICGPARARDVVVVVIAI